MIDDVPILATMTWGTTAGCPVGRLGVEPIRSVGAGLEREAADFDHVVLLNRRVIAFGRPADVFTEENLSAAFQRHLFVLPQGTTIVGP